ncbi:DUF397 domain-containing protein [Kibdelosporangium phytohabitans]
MNPTWQKSSHSNNHTKCVEIASSSSSLPPLRLA